MRLIAAASALVSALAGAEAATLGAAVNNTASVTYDDGVAITTVKTPTASFIVEAKRTPSSIEFFRYAPLAPDAVPVRLNGSDYKPAGASGFQPVGALKSASGAALNTASPLLLTHADNYFSGEPIIACVTDLGQNGDPASIETLEVGMSTANGDAARLRFYETGANSGVFCGWIATNNSTPVKNDAMMSITNGAAITVRYQDPFDASEISTASAGVDPFGRLFDGLTGALIDGATVTIIDDATGAPANVFGIDGVSAYPSTIVTGQTVTDAGGMVYALGPGEFLFPIMAPGDYRLVITPPSGYSAPSAFQPPAFASLPNAPFTIIPASYGQAFTLAATGDVELDVPLDPITDIVVTKSAGVSSAAIGDFVRYEITAENRGQSPAPARFADALPAGMRYRKGSARADGAVIADPVVSADGAGLIFDAGLLPAGATRTLAYVAEVTSGARSGEAVNSVEAVSLGGVAISNRAEAAVEITDDFLRNGVTILGRISKGECGEEGDGLVNIRLYLETGATVVTDKNGLYHFEDVSPRTHVVQVDEASLPEGYELVSCRDNTRKAGSARSQFVDVQGGAAWRANFRVRRKAGAAVSAIVEEPDSPADIVTPDTEYRKFDKAWLETQSPEMAWAYPAADATPTSPSVNIGLKHRAGLKADLFVNGRPASIRNFAGREVNKTRVTAISRWRGVDLLEGENRIEAVLKDKKGVEIGRISRKINYINNAERVSLIAGETRAFADGKSKPVIALKVTDGAGRPVRAGRLLSIEVSSPYQTAARAAVDARNPLTAPLATQSSVPVGQNGVALIELEPTVETGPVQLTVALEGGAKKKISSYVRPALRDFIIVGLAEGEGSLERSKSAGAASPRDLLGDGRIAGFAKGTVKGGWLVTVAGDTDKSRGGEDDQLFDVVDPDRRYPLYGDQTTQTFEAQSRYPVYLKAEKGAFLTEFGDFQTGLTQSELSKYDRRLSGLRSVYSGERFSFNGFAAETNQNFLKDELAADGTSGPFRLSAAPLVRNSESITIETRDRFRPDVVLETKQLLRYADYDIDFTTGEIILRLPAPAADAAFNPNVLVIDYETSAAVSRNVTAGGRAAVKFLGGRGEAGASFIHEEAPGATGERTNLAGVDLKLDISEADSVAVEYAKSLRDGPTINESADAFRVEARHTGERLSAKAYYAEVEPGFGLTQQNSAIAGVRRYGGEASLKINEFENKEGTQRGRRSVVAKAYREESLVSGATRSVAEASIVQESNTTSGSVGLRGVREEPAGGPVREGLLLTASAKQRFDNIGLSLRAAREQPIAGDNASALFPARTSVGFDQKIIDGVTLSATHEILKSEAASQSNTVVGLTAEPWSGGKITASADRITGEAADRLGATFAVDQQVKLDKNWSASLGMARREDLKGANTAGPGPASIPDAIVPDAPLSPFEAADGNYTSLYVGAGYRHETTSGSTRFEIKKTGDGERYTFVAGAARDVSEELSFAAAARFEQNNNEFVADERRFEARLGASWRPHDDDGFIIFNRFDVKQLSTDLTSSSWKAVHNLSLNAQAGERLFLAVNHGLKYSRFEADGLAHDEVTQLLGAEARYDITRRVDIGFHGEGLYAYRAKTLAYSFGPSIGFSPADNVWFSLGYNIRGFDDQDFAAADYSHAGPYLKLRIKFDQSTARGLLDAISPGRSQ